MMVKSFDDIFDANVGLGMYQYKSFIFLGLSLFLQGFQNYFLAIVLTVQRAEFNLTDRQIGVLIVTNFFGMFVGYILLSTIADKIGRKRLLFAGLVLLSFALLLYSYVSSVFWMALCRTACGMTIGIILGSSFIQIVELVPPRIRGRCVVAGEVCFIFGILYMTILCILTFESFDEGNWKLVLRLNSVLSAFCSIGVLLWVHDTPRFHLVKGRCEVAFDMIDRMGFSNKKAGYATLSENEKLQLKDWLKGLLLQDAKKPSFKSLFKNGTSKLTIMIWSLSVTLNLLDKSFMIILPFVFMSSDQTLFSLFVAHSVELPAALLSGVLIDSRKWGGRVRGLQGGFFLLNLSLLSLAFVGEQTVLVAFFLVRFSVRVLWSYYNTLIVESYTTLLRTRGVGSAQTVGKLSGIFAPLLILPVYFEYHYKVFFLLFIIGIIAHIILCLFPMDMTKQPLDKVNTPKQDFESVPKASDYEMQDIERASLKDFA